MFETAIYMPTDLPIQDISDVAIFAEESGFDYFLVPDEGFTRDVFVALTSIALRTKKIKFGPAIVNPYTRHPVTSAITVATLNEISQGRAFIGFGVGGSLVLGPLGIESRSPLSMCKEAVIMSRRILNGETVNYQGEFFNLRNARIQFNPYSEIPILMAGRGNKMLEQAGQLADGVLLSGIAKFDLQRSVDLIKKGASKNSKKPKIFYDVHLVYNDELLQSVRSDYTFMIIDSPEHVKKELGLSPDFISEINSVMLTEGLHKASVLISEELLSKFIIMGDPDACANEITELMEVNQFDVFTVPIPPINNPIEYIQKSTEIINRAKKLCQLL